MKTVINVVHKNASATLTHNNGVFTLYAIDHQSDSDPQEEYVQMNMQAFFEELGITKEHILEHMRDDDPPKTGMQCNYCFGTEMSWVPDGSHQRCATCGTRYVRKCMTCGDCVPKDSEFYVDTHMDTIGRCAKCQSRISEEHREQDVLNSIGESNDISMAIWISKSTGITKVSLLERDGTTGQEVSRKDYDTVKELSKILADYSSRNLNIYELNVWTMGGRR